MAALDAYELAKKYYPKYWDESRLANLTRLKKLTPEQYKEITGMDYQEEKE